MLKHIKKILRSKGVRAYGAGMLALALMLSAAVADMHVRVWEFLLSIRNYVYNGIENHNGELHTNSVSGRSLMRPRLFGVPFTIGCATRPASPAIATFV